MRSACSYAYYIQNSLLVAASGNNGILRICYPARYDTVIAVGAINKNEERCTEKDWGDGFGSNYGPELDLVAPGHNIYSTIDRGSKKYAYMSGTSMACPHVAGVAALYFSKYPTDGAVSYTHLTLPTN